MWLEDKWVWLPEERTRLQTLWIAGLSATRISDIMDCRSRGRVIGQIRRMTQDNGEPLRPKREAPPPPPPPPISPVKVHQARRRTDSPGPRLSPTPPENPVCEDVVDIVLSWKPQDCRWLDGEVRDGLAIRCNRRRLTNGAGSFISAYCPEHHQRAKNPFPWKPVNVPASIV